MGEDPTKRGRWADLLMPRKLDALVVVTAIGLRAMKRITTTEAFTMVLVGVVAPRAFRLIVDGGRHGH